MTLGDFEILPGVVINVDDPLNQGRVKACAPGLFDTSTMEMDDLFWINPFMMIGQQSFSKMELNSKTIKKILFIIFCGAVIFTAIQKLPSVWAGFSVVNFAFFGFIFISSRFLARIAIPHVHKNILNDITKNVA